MSSRAIIPSSRTYGDWVRTNRFQEGGLTIGYIVINDEYHSVPGKRTFDSHLKYKVQNLSDKIGISRHARDMKWFIGHIMQQLNNSSE